MRIGYYTAKIYADDIDPEDIQECSFPISGAKALYKAIARWNRLHVECKYCETPCKLAKADIDYSDSVLIIKVNTLLKSEALQQIHEAILKQKETGVVILPEGYNAILVPKDLDIEVENGR